MAKRIQSSTIIDFALGRLTSAESLGLLESIEKDPRASDELDLVVDLMNEAADPRSSVFRTSVVYRESFLPRIARSISETIRSHPFLYPAGAFGSFVAALGVLACLNLISGNPLNVLTGIDGTAFSWNARGGADNSDIAGAYVCFTHGEYSKSLSLLDRHIRLQPNDDLAPYVHYSAGAVCLIASKRNYFALFQTYDAALISEALQHLSLAMSRSTNRRLLEESRFLRAKGFLMLNKPFEAIAVLDTVRSLNGPRSDEAMQMIERIHALTP